VSQIDLEAISARLHGDQNLVTLDRLRLDVAFLVARVKELEFTERPAQCGRSVEFRVAGLPVPQGSMKGHVIQKQGQKPRVAVTSDNVNLKSWRAAVTEEAQAMARFHGCFTGPVLLGVTFTLPRPDYHYGRRGLLPSAPGWPVKTKSGSDLDKLVRSICDSITDARLWRDDKQVVYIDRTGKFYGELPGVRIVIRELSDVIAPSGKS